MTLLTSPSWPKGAIDNRSEAEVRAIRARRARLEAALIEEDAPEAEIARLATNDNAARMVAYERDSLELVARIFEGIGWGLK